MSKQILKKTKQNKNPKLKVYKTIKNLFPIHPQLSSYPFIGIEFTAAFLKDPLYFIVISYKICW